MTQTAADNVRITYPLNDDDIRELEDLESKLKGFAEDAEKKNRVALHRVYNEIMKGSTITIARAKLRSAREANADRTRRHRELKKKVKETVLAGGDPNATNGTNSAPSTGQAAKKP